MSRRANDDTLVAYTDLLAEIVRDLLSIIQHHPDAVKHHIDRAVVNFAEAALVDLDRYRPNCVSNAIAKTVTHLELALELAERNSRCGELDLTTTPPGICLRQKSHAEGQCKFEAINRVIPIDPSRETP